MISLEEFVDRFVAPTVVEAGFSRQGSRRFLIAAANRILLEVRSHPYAEPELGFMVEWSVIPAASEAYFRSLGSRRLTIMWGMVASRVEAPVGYSGLPIPGDIWVLSDPETLEPGGRELRRILAEQVLPWLVRMTDPDVLINDEWTRDWMSIPAVTGLITLTPADWPGRFVAVHVDDAPVEQLQAMIDEYERTGTHHRKDEWVAWWRSRLAARAGDGVAGR